MIFVGGSRGNILLLKKGQNRCEINPYEGYAFQIMINALLRVIYLILLDEQGG